jgi:putative spermidine/putrescine transport system substrate-binding protein
MFKRIKTFVVLFAIALVPFVAVQSQDSLQGPIPAIDGNNIGTWDQVLELARGEEVNWWMWGGSDRINGFVNTFYGGPLDEEFGITFNQVPLADTVDAVNQVLSEAEADVNSGGAVDMIWINGENFKTLKQADLLFGPWAEGIPNSRFVAWDNPALNRDFGLPVDGFESPWSSAQFQFVYDTARTDEADLPRSFAEMVAFAEANPGQVTYIAPGPGAFQGTRFVKQVLFEISGGQEQWVGDFNQALWDEWSPQLWDALNALEPNLWRAGETYPADVNELDQLFSNGEILFSLTQAVAGASPNIDAGTFPATAKAYVWTNNMIGDFNYVAIPFNASNKAPALVLSNLILRPDRQAFQVIPENGFGLGFAIDVNLVDPADRAVLELAVGDLGPGAADPGERAAALVSDIVAEYQTLIEDGWEANVLQN